MRITFITGAIPAGFPSPAQDYMEEDIDLNELLISKPLSTFIIRVKGDSMADAFIPPEALLVVDKSAKPTSGKIVVAHLNGEFTVKRLVKTSKCLVLHPENPAYEPLVVTEEMGLIVWGVVTWIISLAK